MPGKLQAFQPSTLRRRHSWSIWPFANMETVERMVLSQWSLLDTCTSALSSVLVIDMNWIAARTPHQLARLARHWTSTSAYILPAWQILFNARSCSNQNRPSDSWQIQDSWKPSHKSISNQGIFFTQRLRCLENSSFFSPLHCGGDTLDQSDLLTRIETGKRMFLSQWSLADTCIGALSSVLVIDMNWIAARTPHQLAKLARF